MRKLILFVLLSVGSARENAAQTIRGQVVDSISGTPVDRGFIVVVDESGQELQRVLTTTQGRFTVQVVQPGAYRLRSERIGFRVWQSALLRLDAGHTYEVNPLISALPRRLETINVSEATQCEERKGPDTGLLWEEARKALIAASWSAAQNLYVHRTHRFDRVLDRGRDRVSEEIAVQILSSQLPFVSADPDTLATFGYIIPDSSSGEWEWWAPDANVLLDPTFHATHCFWAVRGEDDNRGLIGLSFEPAPDRELPDVAGTLWLDEQSAELRHVEFGFRNLPFNVSARHSGGRAEFVRMPSGAWILDRWHIMIPQVRGTLFGTRIAGYQETGGTVIEAYTTDGDLVYENPGLVVIRGTVYDSSTNDFFEGDIVTVFGTEYVAETDSSGSFEIRALLDGRYTLLSRRMEWLGYTRGRIEHDYSPGETIELDIIVPTLETIHGQLCRGAPPDSNRMLHGEVRTPTGDLLEDAEVRIEWAPGIHRRTKTEDDGRYVLCDLPNNTVMTLSVKHELFESEQITLRFVERDFLVGTGEEASSFYAPDRIVRLGIETHRVQSRSPQL